MRKFGGIGSFLGIPSRFFAQLRFSSSIGRASCSTGIIGPVDLAHWTPMDVRQLIAQTEFTDEERVEEIYW